METLINNLNRGIGGFVDLGIMNTAGRMAAYTGPYNLKGADLCHQECFTEVLKRGVYFSNPVQVEGQRQQVVIGIKYPVPGDSFFILRATIDARPIVQLLDQLDAGRKGDAFIVNQKGRLATPSRLYGRVHDRIPLSLPPAKISEAEVIEDRSPSGEDLVIGYARIPDTSFILMLVRPKDELLEPLRITRIKLLGFLGVSVVVILIAVLGMATYLVHRIHAADQERIETLHQVEYANKMASLGRLSAGVAHEINNPLAIIGEKVGLVKDLFTFKKEYIRDEKLITLIDDALDAVQRCGNITQRLLNFASHRDSSTESVELKEVISEMIAFLEKDAEYRKIGIFIDIPKNIPILISNRGNLQQIFLNLFNNAFAAMNHGGLLEIIAKKESEEHVSVTVSDNGCGIPPEDLGRVFEPFFCTTTNEGCTGLGLSVTFSMVEEIGGTIFVKSKVGKGTSFKVVVPLKMEKQKRLKACPYYPIK